MKRAVDALVGLLEDWARWQRHEDYGMRLGYPTHSAGFGGRGGIHSFEDLCEEVDGETMRTVDAAINDLPPAQRAAIMRRYGVASVFRFPRYNYEECLAEGHEALMGALARRGVMV